MTFGATPLLYGVLACLSWACGSVLTKALLSQADPLTVLSGQLTASVVGLWTISLARKSKIRLDEWRIGLPGIFQPGLAYGLSIIGLAQLPVTLEAMIFAIETPLILLLAWPLLGERPTGLLAALGLLAFAGVLILTWRPEIAVTSGEGFAVSLIVSAALFAALYSVIVRRMSADVDALRLTRASQTIGWLAVLIVWWAMQKPQPSELGVIDATLIAGSGLLLNAIPFFLYGLVLERASAGFAALLLPLVPLMTAAIASGVLGETLSSLQWLGALLVLSSVAALSLTTKPAPR
ncbi:MAG TPA: DMT family transporter [Bradyrhizobium sp.]|jgi:drug/metabolite transporter (DMT)-like permease|uniref:DMT family transporter n=1 Tax=Bradyrhizobium sp. TaxID=376 RepID=UPI002B8BB676|nr:DMT family transporter [Bradyrhizobium sp.]HXB80905.1 DMT family transporter [Bradyrhizobium sp.]